MTSSSTHHRQSSTMKAMTQPIEPARTCQSDEPASSPPHRSVPSRTASSGDQSARRGPSSDPTAAAQPAGRGEVPQVVVDLPRRPDVIDLGELLGGGTPSSTEPTSLNRTGCASAERFSASAVQSVSSTLVGGQALLPRGPARRSGRVTSPTSMTAPGRRRAARSSSRAHSSWVGSTARGCWSTRASSASSRRSTSVRGSGSAMRPRIRNYGKCGCWASGRLGTCSNRSGRGHLRPGPLRPDRRDPHRGRPRPPPPQAGLAAGGALLPAGGLAGLAGRRARSYGHRDAARRQRGRPVHEPPPPGLPSTRRPTRSSSAGSVRASERPGHGRTPRATRVTPRAPRESRLPRTERTRSVRAPAHPPSSAPPLL